MGTERYCPPGYLSKKQAAERLGICVKTLDRRLKTQQLVAAVLRKGRQVYLSARDIEAYFRNGQERGYI